MTIRKINNLSFLIFLAGFFLLALLATTLLFSSVGFFAGLPIGRWQFPAALLLTSMIVYRIYARSDHQHVDSDLYVVLGLPIAIIIFSLLFSAYFYDRSYDGQAYHMEAIIQLKQGWNPYWQTLPNSVNQVLWVSHYAKGMETVQAAIYGTFNNIEAGKATNVILWVGSFFLALSYLCRRSWVSLTKAVVISALLASNPVVMNQMISTYVDGPMASMLLSLIVTGLFLMEKAKTRYLLLLGFLIILLVNVKFTALLYLGLFVGGFFVWALLIKKVNTAKKIWWTSVFAGFIAVLVGFNPYIVNTIQHENPLYPLVGKDKVDIIHELNLPAGFEGKSGIERFFISFFARTDNIYPKSDNHAEIKIPFTFNIIDAKNAGVVDARLGGFGPMFSGIFLLSLILLMAILIKVKRQLFSVITLWLTILIVISVVMMPESWWARYVPQLWFLPLIWLFASEALLPGALKIVKGFMYAGLVVNLIFCFGGFLLNLILTSKINYQLSQLKSSKQLIMVDWGDSAGNRIRFKDHGIPYKEVNLRKVKVGEGKEYMAGSQTWFLVPDHIDHNMTEPWLVKITGKRIPYMWEYYGR